MSALAPFHVGVHHLPDDRSGADDRDLHNEVIKLVRVVARERGHLGARFHLEETDGIGGLERLVDLGVIVRNLRDVDLLAVVAGNQLDTIFEDSHHAQTEQVYLDEPHVRAVFLIPLHDVPARHRRGLDGNDGGELILCDDHASRVLAQVPG